MIYFLQPTIGGPVKIGTSINVEARHRQLEAHFGQPLALLAVVEGGPKEERAWHDRFAHLRLGRTEQFRPAFELMEAIGRPLLVGANPEAVEAMPGPHDGTRPVTIERHLATMARYIASQRGISVTELLDEYLRPVIERDFAALWGMANGRVADVGNLTEAQP